MFFAIIDYLVFDDLAFAIIEIMFVRESVVPAAVPGAEARRLTLGRRGYQCAPPITADFDAGELVLSFSNASSVPGSTHTAISALTTKIVMSAHRPRADSV